MAVPVVIPELQFVDANGKPYAGGTLATYVPGTSTPKPTWVDPEGTGLQTNPINLDAAGRCVCWGDGDYRLVLNDAAGNLIWDQPATTIVSAAMEPVTSAPTISEAIQLLGIQDLVDTSVAAEASIRAAAITAEANARTAADTTLQNNIDGETANRGTADITLQNNINAEQARAEAAEAALQGNHDGLASQGIRAGSLTTDGEGNFSVSFSPPYATKCVMIAVVDQNEIWNPVTGLPEAWISVLAVPGVSGPGGLNTTGASGQLVQNNPTGPGPIGALTIDWWSVGY
jgi:hypothetical protein